MRPAETKPVPTGDALQTIGELTYDCVMISETIVMASNDEHELTRWECEVSIRIWREAANAMAAALRKLDRGALGEG